LLDRVASEMREHVLDRELEEAGSPDWFAAAVAALTNEDLDWNDWNTHGMAIYAANSGDEGFKAFDAFSQKSKKYDAARTAKKWQEIQRSPPTKMTAGKLHYSADQCAPGWRPQYEAVRFAEVCAAIAAAPKEEAVNVMVQQLVGGGASPTQEAELIKLAGKRFGGVKAAALELKQAKEKRQTPTGEREKNGKMWLPTPLKDDEAGPIMEVWDDILANINAPEPPMRNFDGHPVSVEYREPIGLHTLTSGSTNDDSETETSRLPAPKQFLITSHDEYSMEIEIGKYITFTGKKGRRSAPPPRLLIHYLKYRASKLPKIHSVLTMPLVFRNGELLVTNGLDRKNGLVMKIDPELLQYVPKREDCTPQAVLEAFEFLVDHWLVDVATNMEGKDVLIALTLSIIERVLFPERPVFFVTAGVRGGGKTTALNMVTLAATGIKPSATQWSGEVEERRKALFAYLLQGIASIVWDNIPRGTVVSCPAIEAASTTDSTQDRILGVSKNATPTSYTINTFTGNNISPQGDLASRSLVVRLQADRPDPENRPFIHVRPIAWTNDHRGQILNALYTLLLGNPRSVGGNTHQAETRFKDWWDLVGSAPRNCMRRNMGAKKYRSKNSLKKRRRTTKKLWIRDRQSPTFTVCGGRVSSSPRICSIISDRHKIKVSILPTPSLPGCAHFSPRRRQCT
jgi:Primase C terminal 2 (PriCT-2)